MLGLLVEQYLAFSETMASQRKPMRMNDWVERLDAILSINGRDLLSHRGVISHDMAVKKSEIEYEKYKQNFREIEKQLSLKELEQDIKRLM